MKSNAIWITPFVLLASAVAYADQSEVPATKSDDKLILYYAHFFGREPLGSLSKLVTVETETFQRHLRENPCYVKVTITNQSPEELSLPVAPSQMGVQHLSVFVVDEAGKEVPRTKFGQQTLLPPNGNDLSVIFIRLAPKISGLEGGQAQWEIDLAKCFDLPVGKYRASVGFQYGVASAPFEFEIVEVK